MKLVRPSKKYQGSFLAAILEMHKEGRTYFDLDINQKNFNQYLQKWRDAPRGLNLRRGWVPSTDFWLVDREQFIGRLNIRHRLNAKLQKMGGNIGYWIRPSKRKMGYGTKILSLGLKEAKKLGIKNALLTCDSDNKGSIRIIEKNGGVFKNEIIYDKKEKPKRRYWIKIK